MAAGPAWADTFVVNSTGDGGDQSPVGVCNTAPFPVGTEPECTLRAAIQEANATTTADAIDFNIGGSGVKTISPGSSLPVITQPVTIDGYSEPGASENTLVVGNDAVLLIQINGGNTGLSVGLNIKASHSSVKGLVINRFGTGIGITFTPSASPVGNRIEGNFIGTDAGGTRDLGNIFHGVFTQSGSNNTNTVGGATPAARNLISGNGAHGVVAQAPGLKVWGNYIGTDRTGTGSLGNGESGVAVSSANQSVGGNTAAESNIIAFNGGDGVRIVNTGATGNRILRNSIFSNAGLGIDLNDDGRTANDGVGDADTGPNNLQNSPVLSFAKTGRRATTIKGTLEGIPTQGISEGYIIQFFKNPKSTKDEGKKFIGERIAADGDGDGIMTFTFKPAKRVKAGMFVTATATYDSTGDTSEFSTPRKVSG